MSCPARTSGVVSLQRQVRERAEVRLVLDEGLSRVRVRGDGADLDVGMCGEDPEDLAARIAGCAGDGDRICHGFHLRVWVRGLERRRRPRQPSSEGAQGRRESASAQTSARGSERSERASRIPGSPKAWADDSGRAAASANRAALGVRETCRFARVRRGRRAARARRRRVRPALRSRSRPRSRSSARVRSSVSRRSRRRPPAAR